MGSGSWNAKDWATHSTASSAAASTRGAAGVFSRSTVDKTLEPMGVKLREARDSADNPESTPIIVALDYTGSMSHVNVQLATKSLGVLFTELYARQPVKNPQVMFMGFGDVAVGDPHPFQVSQFESDNRIVDQLTKMYLVGGGGGNNSESYHLPWYFAAKHTSIDSMEKRGKKGYLFTLGDEGVPPTLKADHVKSIFGYDPERDYTAKQCLEMAQKKYEVFHLVIAQGSNGSTFFKEWQEALGQRAILVTDHTKISEIITSIIQVLEGEAADKVIKSWKEPGTALVVKTAIQNLIPTGASKKVVRL